jgi:lysophospholipase L1-like esterase
MRKLKLTGICLLLQIVTGVFAQTALPPFWQEIQAFKRQDTIIALKKNQILFVGSSSFTMWTDVQRSFLGYKIINRGFGGSSLPDVIRYADEIILPYRPKQIVIYCGENDLAASDSVTADMVLIRFVKLFELIRKKLPKVHIAFVSMKPSPARQRLMSQMLAANSKIKNYLSKKERTAFVDVYYKMLKENGMPKENIFKEDMLHMNAKGYVIWQKAIKPYLLK